MATVDELVTRAGKTGLYTDAELAAFRAALGPTAKPAEKEAALDGLMMKLETAAATSTATATPTGTGATATRATAIGSPAVVDPTVAANTANVAAGGATSVSTPSAASNPLTPEQWLATAPEAIRSVVRDAMAQRAAMHAQTVAVVRVAALAAGYTEETLTAMSIEDLKRLAALAKVDVNTVTLPPVDFSGAGLMTYGQPPEPRRAGSPLRMAVTKPVDAWSEALAAGQKAN